MRIWFLSVLLALTAFCQTTEVPKPVHETAPAADEVTVPQFSTDGLSADSGKGLEAVLPANIREFFIEADVLNVQIRERKIAITDAATKRKLLDAIFWDVAGSFPRPKDIGLLACLDPNYRVSVARTNADLLEDRASIVISYHCGHVELFTIIDNREHKYTSPFLSETTLSKTIFDGL